MICFYLFFIYAVETIITFENKKPPMKKNLLILIFNLLIIQIGAQSLRTTYSNDYSRWDFNGKNFRTTYSNDYSTWEYGATRIKTTYSNDFSRWNAGSSTSIKTVYSNDYSRWEITGNGKKITVKTTYSNDYTRWDVSGDATGSMRLTYSNDYSRWDINVDFKDLPEEMKAAIVFIAVNASLNQRK